MILTFALVMKLGGQGSEVTAFVFFFLFFHFRCRAVVSAVASDQEGRRFDSLACWAFFCVECLPEFPSGDCKTNGEL